MELLILTSADHFQHYIPLYTYCAKKYLPQWEVTAYLRGSMDGVTREALSIIGAQDPRGAPDAGAGTMSAENLHRFLINPATTGPVLITDADLLLFVDPLEWHRGRMLSCYAGHHGPHRKAFRPEITGADGWRGQWERVAGGFVLVMPEWYDVTREARKEVYAMLKDGKLAPGFRELDEVWLARIMKMSGLPVVQDKYFPTELRGIHLGDFKDSMTHRWKNMEKMQSLLTNENCLRYVELSRDETWKRIVGLICSEDEQMDRIIGNLESHLRARGIL